MAVWTDPGWHAVPNADTAVSLGGFADAVLLSANIGKQPGRVSLIRARVAT